MKKLISFFFSLTVLFSVSVLAQTDKAFVSYKSRGGTKIVNDKKEVNYIIKNTNESQIQSMKSTLKQFKEVYSFEAAPTAVQGQYKAVLLAHKACTTERFEELIMACGMNEMEVDGKLIPVNDLHNIIKAPAKSK